MTKHSDNDSDDISVHNHNHTNGNGNACFICANHNPKFWSISDCQHVVCAECTLRLRVLYESMACPMCKIPNQTVVICTDSQLKSLSNQRFAKDPTLLIEFYDKAAKNFAIQTLSVSCPVCKQNLVDKNELKKHIHERHKLFLCDICLINRKVFTYEIKTFTTTFHLERHQKVGDETATKGHPQCPCCHSSFYSTDELDHHLRVQHEQCHICHRRSMLEEELEREKQKETRQKREEQSKQVNREKKEIKGPPLPQDHQEFSFQYAQYEKRRKAFYFRDYKSLEDHFEKSHFPCRDSPCRDLKFVVFEFDFELRKHMADVHLSKVKLQRSQQQELLRINVQFTQESRSNNQERNFNRRRGEEGQVASMENNANYSNYSNNANNSFPTLSRPVSNERIIIKDFLFGDAIDHLSSNSLQSIKLLEEKNDAIKQIFSNLKIDFHRVRIVCIKYHQGQITCEDLILQLKSIIESDEQMKRLWKNIVLLEPTEYKQKFLGMAFESYFRKLDAFPGLPFSSPPTIQSCLSFSNSTFNRNSNPIKFNSNLNSNSNNFPISINGGKSLKFGKSKISNSQNVNAIRNNIVTNPSISSISNSDSNLDLKNNQGKLEREREWELKDKQENQKKNQSNANKMEMEKKNPLQVLRLVDSGTVTPLNVIKKSDPASNPLLVLSNSKRGKKKSFVSHPPPSFSQIISTNSLVGIIKTPMEDSNFSISNLSLSDNSIPLTDSNLSFQSCASRNGGSGSGSGSDNGIKSSNHEIGSIFKMETNIFNKNEREESIESISDTFKLGEGGENTRKINDKKNKNDKIEIPEKNVKSKSQYKSGKLIFKSGHGFQS